ncbi:MAG: 3-phosphoshikimate 1-carboxyvinyltransferase, partial [Patescibacteria group bacterium]
TKITRQTKTYEVESDASSASYMGAYTALHPNKTVLLKNIYKNSIQGDTKFIKYLEKIGCRVTTHKKGTTIKSPRDINKLKSLGTIDMNETPDLVMTFAVLALFTKEKTKITNIENLRIKETDRISALENELKKLGAKVKTGKDWIEILPREDFPSVDLQPLSKIRIETYNDHRMAMSFGILTDIFRNLTIKNPSCVSKSYTTFWKDLKKISKTN